MKEIYKNTKSYFAAANGYAGFKSYFDTVFDYKKLERLYILKGGPGTGKSSIMKGLLSNKELEKYQKEAIYCSSDPSSLDGVIIGGKLAVIDGTAPHECDTRLPGAVDEIINLGDNWNSEVLKNKRDEITKINIRKKEYYSSAYKYLSFCKDIDEHIYKTAVLSFDFEKAKKLITELVKKNGDKCDNPNIRLISSFGKYGYYHLKESIGDYKTLYNISGIYGSDSIFLSQIKSEHPKNITLFLSPFNSEKYEGVVLDDSDIAFISNGNSETKIDTRQFLNIDKEDLKNLEELQEILNKLLKKSEEFFSKASDEHFKLEKIYTEAMNFSENEKIIEKLCKNALKILSR